MSLTLLACLFLARCRSPLARKQTKSVPCLSSTLLEPLHPKPALHERWGFISCEIHLRITFLPDIALVLLRLVRQLASRSSLFLCQCACASSSETSKKYEQLALLLPEYSKTRRIQEFNKAIDLLQAYCLVSTGIKFTCTSQLEMG
jgi:hypothetical protein